MIRVLYDHQIFSLQRYGGISRYFSEIVWRMDRLNGFSARLFTPFFVNRYIRRRLGRYNARGVFCHVPDKSVRAVLNANGLFFRLTRPWKGADIVHQTYFMGLPCPGKPTVVTVYDMIHEKFSSLFPPNPVARLKKQAVEAADAVICISHNTRRDLLERVAVDPSVVFVTHLGFSTLPAPESSAPASAGGRPYLLFVGKRDDHKNFLRLLKAYAGSPRLRSDFSILCFGWRKFTASERRAAAELGLGTENMTCSAGGDRELATAYAHAAAFVYPSLYEGFGIPPLESMSLGCPVVCSDNSSLPEVVGDAAATFDPESAESMRGAIEAVVYSTDRRMDLANRGKQRCRQFTWDACTAETAKIYSRVLGK